MKITGDAEEKVTFQVEIVRPTGGILGTLNGEGELGKAGTLEVNFNINGLQLPDWGLYMLNIHVNDATPKPLTFTVEKSKPPSGTEAQKKHNSDHPQA